jgi:RNA polymerase sigma-70 factor (ECF subfamily)
MAERRREARRSIADRALAQPEAVVPAEGGDAAVTQALHALAPRDREALVLIAWDNLTPAQAAQALGITAVAFRVRLLRARRRFERLLAAESTLRPSDVIEVKSA